MGFGTSDSRRNGNDNNARQTSPPRLANRASSTMPWFPPTGCIISAFTLFPSRYSLYSSFDDIAAVGPAQRRGARRSVRFRRTPAYTDGTTAPRRRSRFQRGIFDGTPIDAITSLEIAATASPGNPYSDLFRAGQNYTDERPSADPGKHVYTIAAPMPPGAATRPRQKRMWALAGRSRSPTCARRLPPTRAKWL